MCICPLHVLNSYEIYWNCKDFVIYYKINKQFNGTCLSCVRLDMFELLTAAYAVLMRDYFDCDT